MRTASLLSTHTRPACKRARILLRRTRLLAGPAASELLSVDFKAKVRAFCGSSSPRGEARGAGVATFLRRRVLWHRRQKAQFCLFENKTLLHFLKNNLKKGNHVLLRNEIRMATLL